MQDEEFPNVFRKFTYVNLDEFIEKNKEISNYNKIERKEYSKSATSNPNTNIIMNRVKGTAVLLNNSKSNIYGKKDSVGTTVSRGTVEVNNTNNTSILNGITKQGSVGIRSASNNKDSVLNDKNSEAIGNKSLRSKIKISNNPGSSSMINLDQKSAILANHVNIDLNNINNPGSNTNRNNSQFKERKIIGGVASSIIFDDNKLNRSSVKVPENNMSSIRSNSNLGSSLSNNNYGQSGVINFNNNNNNSSNTNNFIKSSVILNQGHGSSQKSFGPNSNSNLNNNINNVNSKLPEIESKLEKMKKITGNSIASTGLYSARGYIGSTGLGSSSNSILLSGISKKITPTKVINPNNNLSNNNITQKKIGLSGTIVNNQNSVQKLSNYSSINSNSKRDLTSPMHYLTHREGSNK